MIYYCVRTSEYLADILDRVSRGAEYYLQIDVSEKKAKAVIQKWAERYCLELSPRQRTYRLKSKAVADLIVLQSRAMKNLEMVRMCLLVTIPVSDRQGLHADLAQNRIKFDFELDKGQSDYWGSVHDRKGRITQNTAIYGDTKKTSIPVYELVELPFTKEERKQKELNKTAGWTWRLHKDFIKLKMELIEGVFKDAQRLKDREKQDMKLTQEMAKLWGMCGFRGVRDDVFNINRKLYALSFKYLNRKNSIDLQVPPYTRKQKRTVHNLEEMLKHEHERAN